MNRNSVDYIRCHHEQQEKLEYDVICLIFRAIFDLSNKIALLILLRMFALYAEKAKN